MVRILLAGVVYVMGTGGALLAQAAGGDQTEFFEKKIRPILVKSCQACHNSKLKSAELDLSSAEGFVHGGASGPLVSKAEPEKSLLLRVVGYEERLKMPPTGKLSAEQLDDLAAWVKAGAAWPGAGVVNRIAPRSHGKKLSAEDRAYWAFQPVKASAPPPVKNAAWGRSAIDAFILARLEKANLEPAKPAGKFTLLRRATYDLTGLPPTDAEIRDFLADESPGAFAKVVDRLLASPRYGERWGRHWLDIARYADSTGNDEDHRYPYAWRYRDYVIDAFNRDMPYDQFVQEQIAGDLMESAPLEGQNLIANARGVVATGFLALGAKAIAQQDKKKMLFDVYDEQIDVVSKAMLGITLSCARCHDHKFDPLLQKDYYSWVSIFASTRNFRDSESHVAKLLFTPLVPEDVYSTYQKHQDRLNNVKLAIEDVVDEEKARYNQQAGPKLAAYMTAARRVYEGKEDPAKVAAETGLDGKLVDKWAKYLAPEGKIRPFLEEWDGAAKDRQAAVAAKYQERYLATLAEWNRKLSQWRTRARKILAEKNMPPPEKPQFDEAKDPFFNEVYIVRGGPFAITDKEQDKFFSEASKQRLAALRAEEESLKANAPPEPAMACAVQEGEPVAQRVFIRGDYESLGEPVDKGFPLVFAPEGKDNRFAVPGRQSGRMELARWISSRDNPLTARVMVNRIWQKHFGEGIVRTVDNFGSTGERPTHPELLDYLAARFVDSGWSIKAMHREMMLTNTYQMSSAAPPAVVAADPENQLYSRFNRRRLDIEEIRDGLLAIDGSLDLTMGGTMQSGFGTDGENSAGRLSVRPEDQTRRTVYLPLRRANLPALLNLYDFGDAVMVNGKRPITNVAPQALFMMNSEFLTERAANLAKAFSKENAAPQARVEAAYRRVLNRQPQAAEVDAALTYVGGYQKKFPGSEAEAKAWQSLCRVLMVSNEFIYVD
jgi:cytochrome c553